MNRHKEAREYENQVAEFYKRDMMKEKNLISNFNIIRGNVENLMISICK